jgi:hypothetical protein
MMQVRKCAAGWLGLCVCVSVCFEFVMLDLLFSPFIFAHQMEPTVSPFSAEKSIHLTLFF